ncbi:MAG: RagB/SusD family nutrient uptake outer membrane protein [Chitinophagaceae bacterium]
MKHKLKKLSLILVVTLVFGSCKKDYLETAPTDAVLEPVLFNSTDVIIPVLESSYRTMFAFLVNGTDGHDQFGQKSNDLASDLMGNDMVVHSQGYGWFNGDYRLTEWIQPNPSNRRSDIAWFFYYNIIKQMNTLINNVDAASGDLRVKESLKGQALGLRAYCYFNLVNFFQQTYKGNETKPGVPIYLEFAIEGQPRGTVQDVYDLIIADLTAAETLLTGKTRQSKVNIDVSVVQGIRARVALIMEDWPTAATKAAAAQTGYTLMTDAQYQSTAAFSSIANPECMWGSQITTDQATIYASFYSHMDIRTSGYAALGGQKKITKALYDQIPTGDNRKDRFVAPGAGDEVDVDYNQHKLQVPTAGSWAADYFYMRAAEMYLIQAEALARQGGASEATAKTVLETLVRSHYPAYSASTFSGTALLNEILLQRRIELWGEGFSLTDIKRLNQGLARPSGAGNHGSPNLDPIVYTTGAADPRFLMKIPQREIDNNGNMTPADQNP